MFCGELAGELGLGHASLRNELMPFIKRSSFIIAGLMVASGEAAFQLKRATAPDEIALCHRMRQTGFEDEYDLDPAIDTDEHDAKPSTFHFLGWVGGDKPTFENCVAVARCFMFNDHEAEIGRVLVLPKWRQRGFGAKLIEFIEETTADVVTKFVIYAFGPMMPFYHRMGFEEDDWKKPEKGHYLYRMHKVRGAKAG